MATTGIRTGEAVGLDVGSLDPQASTLTVTGKYGKTRKLPLHQSTVDCTDAIPAAAQPGAARGGLSGATDLHPR